MAQYLTIARPYATALFQQAKGNDSQLVAWRNVLQVLSFIMSQSTMTQFVNSPKTTFQQQLEVLTELVRLVIAGDVDLLGTKFKNFLSLLIEHKRLIAVADMLTLYRQLVDQAQKVTEVCVTSAFEISLEAREKIEATLANRFKTKVTATFAVDKSLIGGAIIRTDKIVIDGSIIGKLRSLHQSLNSVKG